MVNQPEIIIPLFIGFLLDCIIGDPHWLPHPIRWFGYAISFGERKMNNWEQKSTCISQKLNGVLLTLILVLGTYFTLYFFLKWLAFYHLAYLIIASVLVFYALANRSLIKESWKVIRVLKNDGIAAGRKQLSMIVGRDTSVLNENQIRTAVLETLAENLSDGVIAPLFFYAIGGVPAMLAYKMANTLDSMIGYKNKRFRNFGWFAAKFDDVLNFVPARLTAVLMALISLSGRAFVFLFKYGRKHSSPNAGYPEAALAGILNCRFGGPNIYHGVLVNKPFIGDNQRKIVDGDIKKAGVVNFCVSLAFVLFIIGWYL